MVALIISVGGTEAPIIKSIELHQPEFVCFYASEGSVEKIGSIKNGLSDSTKSRFKNRTVIVNNPEDLAKCYELALQCGKIVEEAGFKKEVVIADFTGGTKPMSAALVLATVSRGYQFSYVGGTERTKEGLGTVVPGTERVHASTNPWDILALRDREKLEWCFNSYDFEVALEIIRDIKSRAGLSSALKVLFQALDPLVEAYLSWDRFAHNKKILELLKTSLDQLRIYDNLSNHSLKSFIESIEANQRFFEQFMSASMGFKADKICEFHVYDLIANACRRAEETKYDDAIARLYRALEMLAQAKLQARKPPIETSRVESSSVPETIRAEFIRKYGDADQSTLKLPLRASFQLLRELSDPVADIYFENESDIKNILSARNSSILAHGIVVQSRANFDHFYRIIAELLPGTIPSFPKLKLTDSSNREIAAQV